MGTMVELNRKRIPLTIYDKITKAKAPVTFEFSRQNVPLLSKDPLLSREHHTFRVKGFGEWGEGGVGKVTLGILRYFKLELIHFLPVQ